MSTIKHRGKPTTPNPNCPCDACVRYRRPLPGPDYLYLPRSEAGRALAALKANPCMDCGSTYPPECMDFDHVRGTKEFNLSQHSGRTLQEIIDEVDKCELVCSNCHRIRTKTRSLNRRRLRQQSK